MCSEQAGVAVAILSLWSGDRIAAGLGQIAADHGGCEFSQCLVSKAFRRIRRGSSAIKLMLAAHLTGTGGQRTVAHAA